MRFTSQDRSSFVGSKDVQDAGGELIECVDPADLLPRRCLPGSSVIMRRNKSEGGQDEFQGTHRLGPSGGLDATRDPKSRNGSHPGSGAGLHPVNYAIHRKPMEQTQHTSRGKHRALLGLMGASNVVQQARPEERCWRIR